MRNLNTIEILNELDKIQLCVAGMAQNGNWSTMERDLVLERLRTLYSTVLQTETDTLAVVPIPAQPADNTPEMTAASKKPAPKEKKAPAPAPEPELSIELLATTEPATEPATKHEAEAKEAAQPAPVGTISERPIIEYIEEKKATAAVGKETPPVVRESVSKKEILAETFGKTKFLNDILAQYGNTNDLSKKFQQQPLTDLFKAIGINEKFLFVKELFGGHADSYTQTLTYINQAGSFNEAVEYLDRHFTWDFENPTVQKLLELVHRRFG